MIFLALTVPGLVVAYWLYVRPLLRALPMFKQFYAEADGFWQTVWAYCGRSATIAWGLALQALSWALQLIDPIATTLGDPDLRQQIMSTLGADPKIGGYILMAISFITIAARLRGLAEKADK